MNRPSTCVYTMHCGQLCLRWSEKGLYSQMMLGWLLIYPSMWMRKVSFGIFLFLTSDKNIVTLTDCFLTTVSLQCVKLFHHSQWLWRPCLSPHWKPKLQKPANRAQRHRRCWCEAVVWSTNATQLSLRESWVGMLIIMAAPLWVARNGGLMDSKKNKSKNPIGVHSSWLA